MGLGVFIHRSDSIYDDSPAERYQFPKQYLGRVEACVGDWIIYYEPQKVTATRGYFALAKVERVVPDPTSQGMYLALIEPGSYLLQIRFRLAIQYGRARRSYFRWENVGSSTVGCAPDLSARL